jgi:hypothetical protein
VGGDPAGGGCVVGEETGGLWHRVQSNCGTCGRGCGLKNPWA